jgi:GMP synthase (glutamine-hydrolysing)
VNIASFLLKPLRFLVVDGNTSEGRARHRADFGLSPGDAYGETLLSIAPFGSRFDVLLPADEGFQVPPVAAIADYDAVALTGSALHLWQREPAVERQIALAKEVFRAGVPFFGSCWGIQLATVAAGGDVQKNPAGREIGFARGIAPTEAGRRHPLLDGRPPAFDAPAIHLDAITTVAPGTIVLASNGMTPVQAAEIRYDGGCFWGVQYHPEFSLTELAAILARLEGLMCAEGFLADADAGRTLVGELRSLDRDRSLTALAWRHGLDRQVLDDSLRLTELRNWIIHQVQPAASARARA